MFRIPSEKRQLRDLLAQANEIIDTQAAVLESERQWRLKSLPTLLVHAAGAAAAQVRASAAEVERDQYAQRVAELTAEVAVLKAGNGAPRVVVPSPGRES